MFTTSTFSTCFLCSIMAIYKLGEITKVRTGTTPSTTNESLWLKEVPWFTVPDIVNKRQAIKMISKSFRNDWVPEETVLLTTTATIGEVFITKSKCWHSQQISSFDNDEQVVLNRYLYFKLISMKSKIKSYASGSAFSSINKTLVEKIEIDIPSLNEQQKIIDIIEQKEDLFIKYSNTVRIDSFENCKNDMQKLIDIIEPIEMQEEKINNIILNIKILLINSYNLVNNEGIKFSSILSLINSKYENQKEYFATNAVGEFEVSLNKIQLLEKSVPSRAAVTPPGNSFILSKLDGENKVFYFDTRPHQVFSTGFFNFSTEYIDHISGFLLSNSFKVQKKAYSTGTTMRSITNKSLDEIMIKKPNDKNNHLTKILVKNVMLLEELQKLKEKIIKLLIK